MRSVTKLALVALVAVICVAASAATSASAIESLFLTESKKALLFTIDSLGATTIRGKSVGVEGTIKCEESKAHGFALDKLSLARELQIEFKGKCEQTLGTNKGTCTEPIKLASSYGELGLLNGHVVLLVAPETGTEFVEVKCTNGNTKVSGAVIGEFKLKGRDGGSQYGVSRKSFLLLFKAKGTTQEPEQIELLGSLMTGVTLKVEGFFSEKASEEAVQLILFDGLALIDEGLPPEYEGKEVGKTDIAAGNAKQMVTGFEFVNGAEKEAAICEETYTWAQQARGEQFVVTPSYASCKYKGANVPNFTVNAACRYQFNRPIVALPPLLDPWETTQSITGAGCKIEMKLEAEACKVEVQTEAANENVDKVKLSNSGANLKIKPFVEPIKYTSAGCANPIAAAGAKLAYSSEQEIPNARIN